MKPTYQEALQYNIDEAIKIIGEDKRTFNTPQEWLHADDNNPAKIPNNPLLTDYNWVYDHAEELYCNCKLYYQQNQPTEAYYTLFKALINKYPLDDDYNKLLYSNNSGIEWKWRYFAHNLVDFMTYSFDNRLKELLTKPDVMEYFLKYPKIYDIDVLSSFSHEGLEIFLKQPHFANHYTSNPSDLIQLIRKHPKIEVPIEVMLNDNVIKGISRTPHIEEFYYYLHFVREQVSEQPFLDEHSSYCDEQVSNIQNGILPCLQEEYNKLNDVLSLSDFRHQDYMLKQVTERIFKRNEQAFLPKKYIYQELSKYMVIGMYISRNYQTDPFNLLIDIETLNEFADEENRHLQGKEIYNFLTSFEDKTLEEILDFYNKGKSLPLMDTLYDDWTTENNKFITELNSNLYSPTNQTPITKDNITYYDITDITEPIIVHNTAIAIDDEKKLTDMLNRIKTGYKYRICLSVQDQNHNTFYEEDNTKYKKTLKLAYGPLTPNRVGTICHTDAYSQGASDVEIENRDYKRRLYTMQTFMNQTTNYNEIVYLIDGTPFIPIGVICEDEITSTEQHIAEELNIPLLYRQKKESTRRPYENPNLTKRYTYTKTKYVF